MKLPCNRLGQTIDCLQLCLAVASAAHRAQPPLHSRANWVWRLERTQFWPNAVTVPFILYLVCPNVGPPSTSNSSPLGTTTMAHSVPLDASSLQGPPSTIHGSCPRTTRWYAFMLAWVEDRMWLDGRVKDGVSKVVGWAGEGWGQ